MSRVNPVTQDQARKIKEKLQDNKRNECLFVFMMNVELRISDVLPITVGMVRGAETFDIIEQKTRKKKRVYLNDDLMDYLNDYVEDKKDNEYLFQSRQLNKNTIKEKDFLNKLNQKLDNKKYKKHIDKEQNDLEVFEVNLDNIQNLNNELTLRYLKNQIKDVYYLLLTTILETGKSFDHVVNLKVENVNSINLSKKTEKILNNFIEGLESDDFIFQEHKGKHKPITRSQAHSILSQAASKAKVKKFGCHSTRKSYARRLLEQTEDIAFVMERLNHTSMATTLDYLHLTDEQNRERLRKIKAF